ncbi:hypothetical protein HOLleu_42766 [Holothuria leucospilota]|uniref:THAP-type domain-containing protein n=1 Tax=Holothuria leucospilota TaxID=206669 RepID=A0A9Q0YBC3_HOLLE|nr:hypothetical protein HOLleu_42766 [Holothuria leucospilota]
MSECQAYGCVQSKRIRGWKREKIFCHPRLKKISEKRELSQRWLNNIGTGHTVDKFTLGKHKVVCEDHFRPECLEEDLCARLMGETPRKILKPDAVPEILVHRKPKEDTARSDRVLKRSLKKVS